jgi:superfamily II DNA/RNA helicase
MTPADREKSMDDFRKGRCKVLLATDSISRGIDIADITIVVNHDIPVKQETYIHRIGRAGRGDRLGFAISLVRTEEERRIITMIRDIYSQNITDLIDITFNSRPHK